ncbi:MAG TPA: hypothetical protein VK502_00315 [Candidatus Saccharimonadales bacterium]|nr:hypothetical protein [Candidatus Saccharimonadales bacterium]
MIVAQITSSIKDLIAITRIANDIRRSKPGDGLKKVLRLSAK